jgi:hypothetical protein
VGGVLLSMLNDFLFSMTDVAFGAMKLDEALVGFAKNSVVSIASFGVGQIAGSVVSGLGNAFTDVLAKTAVTGVQQFANNTIAGAVNSITYTHGGGFGFDADNMTNSMFGTNALAGYAGGMASTFTSGLMGTQNLRTNTGVNIVAGGGIDAASIGNLNKFVGSGVGALTEYAISGQTTLSMLRIHDVGVLEMHLGGDRPMFGIGMNGYDTSLGSLASGIKGIAESKKVIDWKNGGAEQSRNLDLVAGAVYSQDKQVIEDSKKVWSGELKVNYVKMATDANGNTKDLGYYDRENPKNENTLFISDTLLGGGLETVAEAMAVFAHEGTHYHDNRVEANAHEAGLGTYLNVAKAFGVGDKNFIAEMWNGMVSADNQVANTGTRDNWTLTKEGILKRDGKSGIYKENGKLVNGTAGITEDANGLLQILGLPSTEKNLALANKAMQDPKAQLNLPSSRLGYLDAKDHYDVLYNRGDLRRAGDTATLNPGVVDYGSMAIDTVFQSLTNPNLQESAETAVKNWVAGKRGEQISFLDWTADNARATGLSETSALRKYLDSTVPKKLISQSDATAVSDMFESNFKTAGDTDTMLRRLQLGLSSVQIGYKSVNQNAMLLYTDKVFRGQGGDMGLAKALETSYSAKNYTPDWARGLMIQDVAETFTKINIQSTYQGGGKFAGLYSQLYSDVDEMQYGANTTAWYDKPHEKWMINNSSPQLDCGGFVDLVYHASGLLQTGQAMGDGTNQREPTPPSEGKGLCPANAYFSNYLSPTSAPIPGDAVFMYGGVGHIGILGVKRDEKGNIIGNTLIHCSPEYPYQDPNPIFNSGARINEFGDIYFKEKINKMLDDWRSVYKSPSYAHWNPR